jgi:serine/threonine protein kinase
MPVQSLVVDNRKVYGRVKSEALWLYETAEAIELKRIILLKGLFMEISGENNISLSDGSYAVNISVETDRDEWAARLKVDFSPALRDLYDLNDCLGSGSTGDVYKATCKANMEPVAVKIIRKSTLNRRSESYIRREIQVLSYLDHPNIVRFLGAYESKDEICIVTEYMDEGSLFDWMEKSSFHMSEEESKSVTSDILNGLQFMHTKGVLHRDIKPENILIKRTAAGIQAKIADFGLACFIGPSEWCTEPVGTLRFAAPEVLSRLPYREAADLWSMGVTLYIMLHGTMPFTGKSDEETVLSVLRRKLNFRGKSWTGVSASAVAVLGALLVRHPRTRANSKEVLASEWLVRDRSVLVTS